MNRRLGLAILWLLLGCGGGGAEGGGPEHPDPGTAAPDLEPEPEPDPEAQADAGPSAQADAAPLAEADAAPAVETDAAVPADPAAAWAAKVEHGRRRYTRLCYAACHDPGLGLGAPNLAGKRLTERRTRNQVRQGSEEMDPIPVRRLSDEDLDAIIAYLSTINAVRDVQAPAAAP